MAVMASVRRTQEPMIVSNGASLNVVAVAILLARCCRRRGQRADLRNPIPVIVTTLIGLLVAPSPKIAQQWERAIVLRFGRYIGPARSRAVLDRAVHRPRLIGDRSAHHRVRFRCRADPHRRHGAGQRRCGVVLDGARRREGRARSAGLRARGRMGGANGAARHHRPDDAGGAVARARAGPDRIAEADRRTIEPLGRDGVVGRNA